MVNIPYRVNEQMRCVERDEPRTASLVGGTKRHVARHAGVLSQRTMRSAVLVARRRQRTKSVSKQRLQSNAPCGGPV